jgi:hypothetical protein
VSDPSSVRAADAEREALAQELREHMLAGRLTSAEFEERVGRAYGATTRGELERLKEDLPLSPATLSAELVKRRTRLRRRLVQEASGGITASGVCVAIWFASGASGAFWPVWVIIPTLLPAARNLLRLFARDPDLDSLESKLNSRRARELARERRRHGRARLM